MGEFADELKIIWSVCVRETGGRERERDSVRDREKEREREWSRIT